MGHRRLNDARCWQGVYGSGRVEVVRRELVILRVASVVGFAVRVPSVRVRACWFLALVQHSCRGYSHWLLTLVQHLCIILYCGGM